MTHIWRRLKEYLLRYPLQLQYPTNIPVINQHNKGRIYSECYRLALTPYFPQYQPNFSLITRPSLIPNSNNGVFVQGSVKRGTILSLYPGLYYPALPLCAIHNAIGESSLSLINIDYLSSNNEYIINLNHSGGYLDGKDIDKTVPTKNPYAIAHMVNHPSSKYYPNVISLDFLWKDVYEMCYHGNKNEFHSFNEFSKHVPNCFANGPWYVDSTTNEIIMINDGTVPCHLAGLAYMALEDIHDGSELYFDYKYPASCRPDWYETPKYSPPIPFD